MPDNQTIELIEQAEADAKHIIHQANEEAKKRLNETNDEWQDRFNKVKDTLMKERELAATKVMEQASSYKEAEARQLKQDLTDLEKGRTDRVTKATGLIQEKFSDYVSQ